MSLYTKQKQTRRHRKQTYGNKRGKRREGQIRSVGLTDTTTIYKTDKQPGPTVEHRELYSISCNNL